MKKEEIVKYLKENGWTAEEIEFLNRMEKELCKRKDIFEHVFQFVKAGYPKAWIQWHNYPAPPSEESKILYKAGFTEEEISHAALEVAGYGEEEIVKLEDDGYDFEETAYLVKQGHTKAEIEKNFDELERKHMKEAGIRDAAIDKWQKEGVIDHDL